MSGDGAHIVVVEADTAVRDGIAALLESWGYRTTVYPDAETVLAADIEGGVDCMLLDVGLPGMDGLSLVERLRRDGVGTPILMMSANGDVTTAVRALQTGAQDFIEKPFDDEPLVRRIEAIRSHRPAPTADSHVRALFDTLTRRESQVMREVVAGAPNKAIAHTLGISLKTVEMHRARVMTKTGARTLAHLVRLAMAAGVEIAENS